MHELGLGHFLHYGTLIFLQSVHTRHLLLFRLTQAVQVNANMLQTLFNFGESESHQYEYGEINNSSINELIFQ